MQNKMISDEKEFLKYIETNYTYNYFLINFYISKKIYQKVIFLNDIPLSYQHYSMTKSKMN